ncbi:MAG: hypothetical protein LBI26_01855, partial [Holosporales bacterium]|nr:hypothetical protein [Holosporales bacterium]
SEAIDALTDPTTGPITNISEAIDALTGTGGSITTAITEATTTITEAIDDLTGTNGPITGAITEATTTITEAIDALTDPTTGPITNISAAITALPNTITGATTTTVAQVRGMLIDSGLAEEPEVSDPLDPEGEVVLPSLKPKGFVTLEEVRSMLIASGLVKADASGVGGVKSAGLVYDSGNTFEFSGGIYGSFKNYLTTLSDTIDSINDIKIGEAEIGLFEARFSGLTDYNNVLAVATGESHSDLTDENTPPTITNGDFMKILSLKDFVVEIKNMVYSSRDETGTKSLTFQDKKGNSYVTGETPWTNQLSTIVDSASTLNSLVISMQNEVSGPVAEKMSAYTNPYSITAAINYDSAHA